MNPASPKTIERIKKLLELASSPNENEAKSAMEQAQKLMARHSVSMGLLEDATEVAVVTEEYRNDEAWKRQGILQQTLKIMEIIGPIFGCRAFAYLVGKKNVSSLNFVGFPTNIKVAKYAVDSIIAQGIAEARVQYKQFRTVTFGFSFWTGFAQGLYTKFKEIREEGQGLVVYDKVQEWIKENCPNVLANENYDGVAFDVGNEAGKRAEIRRALETNNGGKLLQ